MPPVSLSAQQRKELKKVANSAKSAPKEKARALIVLLLGEGLKNKEIANKLGIHENTVVKWRQRWKAGNTDAHISDYGQSGGRPRSVLTPALFKKLEKKLGMNPPKNKSRWTVRSLADTLNLPVATCQRALVELKVDLTRPR